MSKSLGNAIGISEAASEIYGKLMSISDELMGRYYELLSDATPEHLRGISEGKVHPMEAKKALAREISARYHGEAAASAAAEEFQRRFQRGGLPDEVPAVSVEASEPVWICRLIKEAGLAKSTGEARRLVAQGAVRIDGERVQDVDFAVTPQGEPLLQVGKRRLARLSFFAG